MAANRFRPQDLEAYLDEALPPADMARIEEAARHDVGVRHELASIHSRRDSGVHSLGEIWRRHRLSCPAREQLGSYLLGALEDEQAEYVRVHLELVGCRYCQANLADLAILQREAGESVSTRRRKYFHSSAGYLRAAR